PLYSRFVALVTEQLNQGTVPVADDFINYPDEEIRTEAINLLSDPYDLSPNWATHQIFVPHETDLLPYGTERAVLRLKFIYLKLMIDEEALKLKIVTDPQEQVNRLVTVMNLKKLHKQIGDMLGIVVF
ncbi:MAG: DNA primase, partial [Pontibacter sp.]|nr:DNA primase [Pontibacter sp.]